MTSATAPIKFAGTTAPFSDAQCAALDALMDLLIPASPDGRMPAARSLHLYSDVANMRPANRALFEEGLAALDRRAIELHGTTLASPFARLPVGQAKRLVDALRDERSPFIQSFVAQTVGRYVAHPTVMPLLGLEARPMWPQGNVVAEGDWSLLDVVKQREKLYRKV